MQKRYNTAAMALMSAMMMDPTRQPLDQDSPEIRKPIKKEKKLMGSLRLRPGHLVWELAGSGELKRYQPAKPTAKYAETGPVITHWKGTITPGRMYFTALNAKNAFRKARKLLPGQLIFMEQD